MVRSLGVSVKGLERFLGLYRVRVPGLGRVIESAFELVVWKCGGFWIERFLGLGFRCYLWRIYPDFG